MMKVDITNVICRAYIISAKCCVNGKQCELTIQVNKIQLLIVLNGQIVFEIC